MLNLYYFMKKIQTKKTVKITKRMTISELLDVQPDSMEILLNAGLHCIGCGASSFEALEDGMRMHGFSDSEIDDIITQLNS